MISMHSQSKGPEGSVENRGTLRILMIDKIVIIA